MNQVGQSKNGWHFAISVLPWWLIAGAVTFGLLAATANGANAETRSLKLHYLHTDEQADIVFKRNGRYDPEGLRKINTILRDWRRNEPTKMDPQLLDLVWETYRASGATGYIQVVSGYRSPATNSMLRRRSRGVADNSQHMRGKALDFFIPGVPLKKLRDIGLRMQAGGVGYYPTSGSPFVHFDTGNVRHWPGISRQELVRLFPNGKTLHIPSDGRPLPGYEQAMAAYKARKGTAATIELASVGGSARKSGGLLTALFGGNSDEVDDSADVAAAPTSKAGVKIAAAAKRDKLPETDAVAALGEGPPAETIQEREKNTPEAVLAALPAAKVPVPDFALRPNPRASVMQPKNVQSAVLDASAMTEQVVATAKAAANIPPGVRDSMNNAGQAPVAMNNPVPIWRPDRSLQADLSPKDEDILRTFADAAHRNKVSADVSADANAARHDELEAAMKQADAVNATSATDSYQLASLEPRAALKDRVSFGAAGKAGIDLVPAGAGVTTTNKQAKPSIRDRTHRRKVIAVPTSPQTARWALGSGEKIASISTLTTAPYYAYNMVYTPPKEIYTAGFQTDIQVLETGRFTGSAVKFFSLARFGTK